jgi:ABC-type multidrug transport system ATPase subunit
MAVIQKARADEIAVCKDGKCVMSEADYKRLKEFIAEVQKRTEANNQVEAQVNEMLAQYQGALETCKERQKQWKTNDARR